MLTVLHFVWIQVPKTGSNQCNCHEYSVSSECYLFTNQCQEHTQCQDCQSAILNCLTPPSTTPATSTTSAPTTIEATTSLSSTTLRITTEEQVQCSDISPISWSKTIPTPTILTGDVPVQCSEYLILDDYSRNIR